MGILRSKLNELAKTDGECLDESTAAESAPQTAPQPRVDEAPNLSSLAKTSRKKRGRGRRPPKSPMTLAELESAPTEPTPAAPMEMTPIGSPLVHGSSIPHTSPLDQVRDLLVGSQLGDFGSRIATLEATCASQARLIAEMRESIEILQAGNDALAERCNNESQSRAHLGDRLETRIATLETSVASTEERLRSEIIAQGTVVTGLVQQRHEETMENLSAGLDRLESDKTGRMALASILRDAARSLHDPDA